jgi:hypothetical protein
MLDVLVLLIDLTKEKCQQGPDKLLQKKKIYQVIFPDVAALEELQFSVKFR